MRPPFFIRGLIAVPLMILGDAPALAQSRNDIDAWQARRDFERLNQQRTDRFLGETEARRRALDAARNRAIGPAPTPPAFRPATPGLDPPPPPRRGPRVVPKPPKAMPPREKPAPPPEEPGREETRESGG